MSERLQQLRGGHRGMAMGLASSAFLLGGVLSGCSSDDDPSTGHVIKQPAHAIPFECDGSPKYIETGDGNERAPYVMVPLVDAKGHDVKADEILLKGIGTDFSERSEPVTRHNHVAVTFPKNVVEVAIFALKNDQKIRCQSLFYPNKSIHP